LPEAPIFFDLATHRSQARAVHMYRIAWKGAYMYGPRGQVGGLSDSACRPKTVSPSSARCDIVIVTLFIVIVFAALSLVPLCALRCARCVSARGVLYYVE